MKGYYWRRTHDDDQCSKEGILLEEEKKYKYHHEFFLLSCLYKFSLVTLLDVQNSHLSQQTRQLFSDLKGRTPKKTPTNITQCICSSRRRRPEILNPKRTQYRKADKTDTKQKFYMHCVYKLCNKKNLLLKQSVFQKPSVLISLKDHRQHQLRNQVAFNEIFFYTKSKP